MANSELKGYKLAAPKFSLIDDKKFTPLNFEKSIKFKNKSKSPNKFQIDKIYIPQGNITNKLTDWNLSNLIPPSHNNLLERSSKKNRRSKMSNSSSMKRMNLHSQASTKWYWGGMMDYLNTIRREPDMSTNANSITDNTLQLMLKNYKDKELNWAKEKKILHNELRWLQEELKAIRSFICDHNPFRSNISESVKEIIPAFIRACNVQLSDDEEEVKAEEKISPLKTGKKLVKRPDQIQRNKYFATPEIHSQKRLTTKISNAATLDFSGTQLSDGLIKPISSRNNNEILISNGKSIFSGSKPKACKTYKGYNKSITSLTMR